MGSSYAEESSRARHNGPPPTPKGRDTRERLLASGRELIGDHGYAKVRISDITSAAGLSPGAFYRYFSDRRALLLEMLRDLTSEAFDFVRVPWSGAAPETSVLESTRRYFAYYERNHALFAALAELGTTDPEVAAIAASSRQRFYGRIAHSMRRGIDEGLLRRDLDVQVAAELLGSMSEFYAFQRFVLRDSAVASTPIDEAAGVLAAIWMNGVRR